MALETSKQRFEYLVEGWRVITAQNVPANLWDWLEENHPSLYRKALELWDSLGEIWRTFLAGGEVDEKDVDVVLFVWGRTLRCCVGLYYQEAQGKDRQHNQSWACGICRYFEPVFTVDGTTLGLCRLQRDHSLLFPETIGCPSFRRAERGTKAFR